VRRLASVCAIGVVVRQTVSIQTVSVEIVSVEIVSVEIVRVNVYVDDVLIRRTLGRRVTFKSLKRLEHVLLRFVRSLNTARNDTCGTCL